MSAFHYKAERIDESQEQPRYRFYLDYLEHEAWQGIAVIAKGTLQFAVESRAYDLTSSMRERETRCLLALQHKLKNERARGRAFPPVLYYVA